MKSRGKGSTPWHWDVRYLLMRSCQVVLIRLHLDIREPPEVDRDHWDDSAHCKLVSSDEVPVS